MPLIFLYLLLYFKKLTKFSLAELFSTPEFQENSIPLAFSHTFHTAKTIRDVGYLLQEHSVYQPHQPWLLAKLNLNKKINAY